MNSQTLEYITAHKDDGAAAIATVLQSDLTLNRRIDRKELGAHLLMTGLDEKLDATAAHPACPAELQMGLRRLNKFLTWGLDYAGTNEAQVGSEVSMLTLALAQFQAALGDSTVGMSMAEAESVMALGGGYYYTKMTTEEVAAAIEEINTTQEAEATEYAVKLRIATAYNAAINLVDISAELPSWEDICTLFASTE